MPFIAAIKFLGKAAAEGAASAIGGEVVGRTMGLIFGGQTDPAIEALGDQLDEIQQSIDELHQALDDSTSSILAALEEVRQEQRYQAWSNKNTEVLAHRDGLDVQYSRMVSYQQNPEKTTPQQVEQLVREILDTNVGAEFRLRNLNTLVLGAGADKGVLELFEEMILPILSAGSDIYEHNLDAFQNYYTGILYAQVQAIYLLTEAFNFRETTAGATSVELPATLSSRDQHLELLRQQEVPFILRNYRIIEGFVYSKETGTRDRNQPLATFRRGLQARSHAYPGWYAPDIHLHRAEELLASAIAGADDRRIVVLMQYPPVTTDGSGFGSPANPSTARLDLVQSADQHGKRYPATRTDELKYPSINEPAHREWSVKRFVFDGLQDSLYVMRDFMGTDGFVPFTGSGPGSTPVHFQNASSLAYTLLLNTEAPFGLLTFTAYNPQTP